MGIEHCLRAARNTKLFSLCAPYECSFLYRASVLACHSSSTKKQFMGNEIEMFNITENLKILCFWGENLILIASMSLTVWQHFPFAPAVAVILCFCDVYTLFSDLSVLLFVSSSFNEGAARWRQVKLNTCCTTSWCAIVTDWFWFQPDVSVMVLDSMSSRRACDWTRRWAEGRTERREQRSEVGATSNA